MLVCIRVIGPADIAEPFAVLETVATPGVVAGLMALAGPGRTCYTVTGTATAAVTAAVAADVADDVADESPGRARSNLRTDRIEAIITINNNSTPFVGVAAVITTAAAVLAAAVATTAAIAIAVAVAVDIAMTVAAATAAATAALAAAAAAGAPAC